jgi:hypothetical protein
VFAGAGGYASAQTFADGFAPAIGVSAGFSLVGAFAATMLPRERVSVATARAVPIVDIEGGS